jgi:hypothetical protein
MAKVLGKSGRYVSDEAVRQRRQLLSMVCAMIAALGIINGVIFSLYIPPGWLAGWGKAAILLAAMVCIWAIDKWANNNLTVIEKKAGQHAARCCR